MRTDQEHASGTRASPEDVLAQSTSVSLGSLHLAAEANSATLLAGCIHRALAGHKATLLAFEVAALSICLNLSCIFLKSQSCSADGNGLSTPTSVLKLPERYQYSAGMGHDCEPTCGTFYSSHLAEKAMFWKEHITYHLDPFHHALALPIIVPIASRIMRRLALLFWVKSVILILTHLPLGPYSPLISLCIIAIL